MGSLGAGNVLFTPIYMQAQRHSKLGRCKMGCRITSVGRGCIQVVEKVFPKC